MFHFTYITASESGYYYVGRHSTDNIYDGYQGSGKWVRYCKRKGVPLHTKILAFYECFEDLTKAEELLIGKHITSKMNLNFNASPSGFSVGELNPSRNPEVVKKRPQNQKGYVSEYMKTNNPSKLPHVKELRSKRAKLLWEDPAYRETILSKHVSKREGYSEYFSKNNPMYNESAKEKVRNKVMESVKNGTHNSQTKLECPHCGKITSLPNAKRWHFGNCKIQIV